MMPHVLLLQKFQLAVIATHLCVLVIAVMGPHVAVQELGRAVTGVWLIPALRLGGVTTSQVVTGSTVVLFDTRSAGDGAATARGTPRRAGGQRAVTRVRSAGLGRVC